MAMMSSSFCAVDDYWQSVQLPNPDMMINGDQLALAASGILGLQDFPFLNDQFFEQLPSFYPPIDHQNLMNFPSLSPEIFPFPDQFDYSPYQPHPKRQKLGFDEFLVHPQHLPPIPKTLIPNLPSQYVGGCLRKDVVSGDKVVDIKKPNGGAVTLSPQSIAARERRRRITEKTQELGRLIPGANKMNTAEMLQSAYKYVKFLQAQVSLLKLHQEMKAEKLKMNEGRLQVLASPILQEKLYYEEKCLVLKEFVEVLANDRDIQSKPLLKDNVDQLLQSNGSSE